MILLANSRHPEKHNKSIQKKYYVTINQNSIGEYKNY